MDPATITAIAAGASNAVKVVFDAFGASEELRRAIVAGEAAKKALADARVAADANAASKANPLAPKGPSDDAVKAAVALADAKLAEYHSIVNEMKKSGVK